MLQVVICRPEPLASVSLLYVPSGAAGWRGGERGRRQEAAARPEARGFERDETRRLSSGRRKPEQTGRRERDLNASQPCLDVAVSYCTVADHDRQVLFSSVANHIWQWQAAAKLNTHWQAQDRKELDGQRRIVL